MKRFRIQFLFVAVTAYTIAGASVSYLSEYVSPVIEQDADTFWSSVFGIDVAGDRCETPIAHLYRLEDGWFYYHLSGLRGTILYRSKASDIAALLERVQACVDTHAEDHDVRGYLALLLNSDIDVSRSVRIEELIAEMNDAKEMSMRVRPDYLDAISFTEAKAARLNRKNEQFWKSQLFEFCWLGTFLLVAIYPCFVQMSRTMLFFYCACATTIFFVPHWFYYPEKVCLAYGTYADGIVYPYILSIGHWMPDFKIDQQLIDLLRQASGVKAFDYDFYFFRVRYGPIATLCLGVTVGGVVIVAREIGWLIWRSFRTNEINAGG